MLTRSRLIKIAAMLKEKVAAKYIKYDADQITARGKKGLGATGRWTGLTGAQRTSLNDAWKSRNRAKFRSLSRQYRGIDALKPAAVKPPTIKPSGGYPPVIKPSVVKSRSPTHLGQEQLQRDAADKAGTGKREFKTSSPPARPIAAVKSPKADAVDRGMRAAGNVWSRKGNRTVHSPTLSGVYRSGQNLAERIATAAKKKAAPLATK